MPMPVTSMGMPANGTYTGLAPIDKILNIIVLSYADSIGFVDIGHSLLSLYLLLFLLPIMVLWYVESH